MGTINHNTSHTADNQVTKTEYEASDHHVVSGIFAPELTSGSDAGKPAAGTAGRLYWATDTSILYRDNGTSWVELLRGETVSRLASLSEKSHASLTGVTSNQHHAQSHGSTDHTGSIFPAANQALAAYYLDIAQIIAPTNPAAGTRRIFVDSVDGKIKVKTSGGSSVSLEEQGGGGADHNLLSATHLDTLTAAVVAGDILFGNATPKWARLAAGVLNRVLKMGASLPAWGQVDHTELTGVTADQHHPQSHGPAHGDAGADEITTALDPAAYPMLAGTLAARPAFGVAGRFYWTTDEGILYRDSGTAWVKVAVKDYADLDSPAGIASTIGGINGASQSAGTTRYMSPFGGVASATESQTEQTIPFACTVSKLYCKTQTNTLNVTLTITVRKNGGTTILTTTIAAGATTWSSDLVNSVSFAAGDTICVEVVAPAGTGAYQYFVWTVKCVA